jgi:hypothetical protein
MGRKKTTGIMKPNQTDNVQLIGCISHCREGEKNEKENTSKLKQKNKRYPRAASFRESAVDHRDEERVGGCGDRQKQEEGRK